MYKTVKANRDITWGMILNNIGVESNKEDIVFKKGEQGELTNWLTNKGTNRLFVREHRFASGIVVNPVLFTEYSEDNK